MSPAPRWPYGPNPRLCVSLACGALDKLRAAVQRVEGADLIEVRLDALDALDSGGFPTGADFAAIVRASPVPVGFTLRPVWEGGGYDGPEAARRQTLHRAAEAGAAFVDVELDAAWVGEFIDTAPCPVVVSHHWMDEPAADLDDRARSARSLSPSVVKLVGSAGTVADSLPFLRLGRDLSASGQPAACFCMGPGGRAGRVIAAARGAAIVYAAAEEGSEVAPGQWPVRRLASEMGVGAWSPDVELFGLLGDPIEHSLSPAIFNAVFRARERNAAYAPVPGANLEDVLALVEEAGFRGVSVTMPFKEAMAARSTPADAVAEATCACNTVVFGEGGWTAYNTDGGAVVAALSAVRDLLGARTVVVGAGGAARAAIVALSGAGADVTVANRSPERAAEAAARAGARAAPLDVLADSAFDVVVNATPVGMGAEAGDEGPTAFPVSCLRGDELVLDMVYRPRLTPLLRLARERGCTVVEGLEMFVRQAAAQYAYLTGDDAFDPLETMRAVVLANLSEEDGPTQTSDAGGTEET